MAEEILRVGLVGCGQVSWRWHAPALVGLSEQYKVVAIADPAAEPRSRMRDFLGLADEDAYEDWAPLVARDDIDVVDVCTPPQFRGPIVIAAANAGKHVIAEKPLATLPETAADMVAAARSAGVKFGVVHNFLQFPHIRAITDAVDEGAIGSLEVAMITNLGNADFNGDAAYDPSWRHKATTAGGGVLMDLLHLVYIAERLLGSPIERVSGWTARQSGSEVEELALCRFEAGANAALVNIGWGVGPNRIDISGSSGKISCTLVSEAPFGEGEVVVTNASGNRRTEHNLAEPVLVKAIGDVLSDFANAVNDDREPLTPGETSQRILEAVFATYESAARGRTVALPLDPDDPVYRHGLAGVAQLESDEPVTAGYGHLVRSE